MHLLLDENGTQYERCIKRTPPGVCYSTLVNDRKLACMELQTVQLLHNKRLQSVGLLVFPELKTKLLLLSYYMQFNRFPFQVLSTDISFPFF